MCLIYNKLNTYYLYNINYYIYLKNNLYIILKKW